MNAKGSQIPAKDLTNHLIKDFLQTIVTSAQRITLPLIQVQDRNYLLSQKIDVSPLSILQLQ